MRFKNLLSKLHVSYFLPSFNFKNRLFIERNNKHARIINHLSTTFRSSKWVPMTMKNITSRFNEGFRVLKSRPLNSLVALILAYYLLDYIIGLPAFKFLITFTWTQFDSAFQVITQWVMLKCMFIGQALKHVFKESIGKFFPMKSSSEVPAQEEHLPAVINEETRPAVVGADKQWTFLNYLTGPGVHWLKDTSLVKMFNHRIEDGVFKRSINTLKSLFNSVNWLALEDMTRSGRYYITFVGDTVSRFIPTNSPVFNFLSSSRRVEPSHQQRLAMEHAANQFVPRARQLSNDNPSTRFVKSLDRYELGSLFEEGSFGYNVVRTPLNPFTLSNGNEAKKLTHSTSYTDLAPLKQAAQFSHLFAEHQRRLYRFSLFHRAILKNSHKITNAKKLITSGFYDSSLTASNLWASEFFNRSFSADNAIAQTVKYLLKQTTGLTQQALPETTSLSTTTNSSSPSLGLNTLNLFEKSYFWNLKRFYNFNTSHSVIQVLGLSRAANSLNETSSLDSDRVNLELVQAAALKSYTLTNPGLTEKQFLNSKVGTVAASATASKDIYAQDDVSAVFNLTNLTVLHDVLSSKDASTNQTRHFPFFTDYTRYLNTSIEELTTLRDLNDVRSDVKVVDPTTNSYASANDRILLGDLRLLSKGENKK